MAGYLQTWFPYALSVGAGSQGSDITGTPFDIEVKARTGFDPSSALRQLKSRRSARLGFAVLRLNGQGENAADYCVVMRLGDFMELVHRCTGCGEWVHEANNCQICATLANLHDTPGDTKET